MARIAPAVLVVLLSLIFAPDTPARTWLILADGTGDCPDLVAGVDSAAASGDTLLLGPGMFSGPNNRKVDFLGKELVVTSQAGAAATVIDCGAAGRAFSLASGESGVISNLTLTNGSFGFGGSIFVVGGSPLITGCVFSGNLGTRGGAINVRGGSPLIQGNRFEGNTASDWGGAIYIDRVGSAVIDNNTFDGNDGGFGGGAIYVEQQDITITGNRIHGNQATAGVIYLLTATGRIEGNTIAENPSGGAGVYLSASSPTLSRNVIASTSPGAAMMCQSGSAPTVLCSVYWGNTGGDVPCGIDAGDNLIADPLFCGSPLSGNYLLRSNSPCAPAFSACGQQIGALGVGCATTPTLPASWGQVKALYLEAE